MENVILPAGHNYKRVSVTDTSFQDNRISYVETFKFCQTQQIQLSLVALALNLNKTVHPKQLENRLR